MGDGYGIFEFGNFPARKGSKYIQLGAIGIMGLFSCVVVICAVMIGGGGGGKGVLFFGMACWEGGMAEMVLVWYDVV